MQIEIDPSLNCNLIRFTELENGKWAPLAFLDEIKERNKPKDTDGVELKIPFFLDFENKDLVK
jgi:hypothetical protein